jgi:hypothetical protein
MSHFKAHWTLLQMCVQIGKKSLKATNPADGCDFTNLVACTDHHSYAQRNTNNPYALHRHGCEWREVHVLWVTISKGLVSFKAHEGMCGEHFCVNIEGGRSYGSSATRPNVRGWWGWRRRRCHCWRSKYISTTVSTASRALPFERETPRNTEILRTYVCRTAGGRWKIEGNVEICEKFGQYASPFPTEDTRDSMETSGESEK